MLLDDDDGGEMKPTTRVAGLIANRIAWKDFMVWYSVS
jgi:hypothetical protein